MKALSLDTSLGIGILFKASTFTSNTPKPPGVIIYALDKATDHGRTYTFHDVGEDPTDAASQRLVASA